MQDYPGRLYHTTPGWVPAGAPFHIRIRAAATQLSLTEAPMAVALLQAA